MSRVFVYMRVGTKSQLTGTEGISSEKKALADRMFSEMIQLRMNRIDSLLSDYQHRTGYKVE